MRKYLLVDDNAEFAENVAEILQDSGAEAVIADGGQRALELCAQHRFDAVVCDMRMPGMGGAEVVHRLRTIDPGLPAVVVTAYTGDDELATARREGLLAVLPKPLPLSLLLQLLRCARRDGLLAIVEDDRAMADNVSEIMREQGFGTVTASTVSETQRLGAVRPFAGLVDLRVPGGHDGEAMSRLAERYPGLPIYVLSGHDQLEPPVATVGRLTKPFDSRLLVDATEQLYAARPQA